MRVEITVLIMNLCTGFFRAVKFPYAIPTEQRSSCDGRFGVVENFYRNIKHIGGVTRPGPENAGRLALWLSVMLAMVLDEYDQRGAQFDAGKLQDNPVFRRKLTQLKLSEGI